MKVKLGMVGRSQCQDNTVHGDAKAIGLKSIPVEQQAKF